jgi:hypothetical protein
MSLKAGAVAVLIVGLAGLTAPAAETEARYLGQAIRIATTRTAEGGWRAEAVLPGNAAPRLATATGASEDEARNAALAAAMAELDRRRAGTGKP